MVKSNSLLLALSLLVSGCQSAPPVTTAQSTSCQRVVVLGPTLTELMLAMGQGDKLVAVSRYDRLPAGFERPSVGGLLDPEVEVITALQADCLFYIPVGPTVAGRLAPLEKLGLRLYPLEVPSLAALPVAVEKMGQLLAAEPAALQLQQQLEQQRQTLTARHPAPLKVVIVYDQSPLIVAGIGSLGHELLTGSGFINPITAAGYPIIDEEYLASLDLDLLLDLSHGEQQNSWARLWQKPPEILHIDNEYLRHPSPETWSNWLSLMGKYLQNGEGQTNS